MSASGYVAAIKGFGIDVLAEADLGFYYGDWVGLVKDDEGFCDKPYGFIVFGYGSCSGCDAWEAAQTAERVGIIANILREARWFEDIDEAEEYVRCAALQNVGYFVHEDGWDAFVNAVIEYRVSEAAR